MGDCIGGEVVAASCAKSTNTARSAARRKSTKTPHQLRIETLFQWAYRRASGDSATFRDPTLSRHDIVAAFTSWKGWPAGAIPEPLHFALACLCRGQQRIRTIPAELYQPLRASSSLQRCF